MNSIPIIQCPIDCLASFHEVREYDWSGLDNFLKQRAIYNPVIADIGANVGAFALWANGRFKNSKVFCYEPHPFTYRFLHNNVKHFAFTYDAAIGIQERCFVKEGRNRLCTTTELVGDIKVNVIDPNTACRATNIIKIDCEGGEGFICQSLLEVPDYLAVEYHSDELRYEVENAMQNRMTLVGSSVLQPGIGILKFAKI